MWVVIFYQRSDGWPGWIALVQHTDTRRLHKRSPNNSCIHNIIFCLPPRYTHTYTLYIGYMSQWVCSVARYCLLPRSHYLPASLPPLSFQWHRKTNAAPSLFAGSLLPPFHQWQTNTTLFLLFSCHYIFQFALSLSQITLWASSPSAPSHHVHVLLQPPCYWINVNAALQPPLKTGFA